MKKDEIKPTSKRISLRTKLLFLLIVLPFTTLSLYLLLAVQLFESDKIAYVFDASATVTRNLAGQLQARMDSSLREMKLIYQYFDTHGQLNTIGSTLFDQNSDLLSISIYQIDNSDAKNPFKKLSERQKTHSQLPNQPPESFLNSLFSDLKGSNIAIQTMPDHPELFTFCFRLKTKNQTENLLAIAIFKYEDIATIFKKNNFYSAYLIGEKGNIFLGPAQNLEFYPQPLTSFNFPGSSWDFYLSLFKNNSVTGTIESETPTGTEILVSYSKLSVSKLTVISLVERATALRAVTALVIKSIFFFVALVSASIIISVFSSAELTRTLNNLSLATEEVAKGNFNIHVDRTSNDELGVLADSFNIMAAEVARLIEETASKARMEKELETGRAVQETLFPEPNKKLGEFEISGFYEPATECGGDWWHYNQIGNKVFLWIGDATGHGVPAALVTSAAKSAATILEKSENLTPAEALSHLNRSIYSTTRGKVMMTFFIACYDQQTRELKYANASHDIPYLIQKNKTSSQPLKRKDLIPLNSVNSLRLGESSDTKYEEASIQLQENDILLFYTDGLYDVSNPNGIALGEKGFLNLAVEIYESQASAGVPIFMEPFVNELQNRIHQFRNKTTLIDDITFFACSVTDPTRSILKT